MTWLVFIQIILTLRDENAWARSFNLQTKEENGLLLLLLFLLSPSAKKYKRFSTLAGKQAR